MRRILTCFSPAPSTMLTLTTVLLASYLAGSLPTSIVAGRVLRGIDIRRFGSGNAGGTNTFRVLGWRAGVVVSLVDVGKGFLAAAVLSRLRLDAPPVDGAALQLLAGLAAVAGHIYPVFAGFRGGKGVGTGAGMLLALAPAALGMAGVVFTATVLLTRYVSLASMLGAVAIPVLLAVERFVLGWPVPDVLLWAGLGLPPLIVYTHRSNVRRLLRGTENRVGGQRAQAGPSAGGRPERR